jgi:iron only hydrogenase large subunit-like protein
LILDGLKLKVAAASGLANAAMILDKLEKDPDAYQFIEIMACPGGCIAGGGQPRPQDDEDNHKKTESAV